MKTAAFIYFMFLQIGVFSQVKETSSVDTLNNLQFYIEHAVNHSPILKMHQANVQLKETEMELLKYAWMREIYVTADTKYGNYGNANPIDQFNLGYGAGAFIRLPVTVIVGNQQRKKIAQLQVDANKMQQETMKEELIKTVITQYEQVQLAKRLLSIQTNSADVALVNFRFAEEEFKAGNIHIEAYSRTSDIYFTQLKALEQLKTDFLSAYRILLEICGLKE